jgi:hypothetical protein
MKKVTHWLLVIATSLMSSVAVAQWQWLDQEGRAVFSDRPPPSSVVEKNILKRPARLAGAEPSATPIGSEVTVAGAPKASGLDKALAEKKKKTDQAEASQRKIEADKLGKARSDNCERAKLAKTSLDSGLRLGRVNAQGEREIMNDAARLLEAKRIQSIIDADCSSHESIARQGLQ